MIVFRSATFTAPMLVSVVVVLTGVGIVYVVMLCVLAVSLCRATSSAKTCAWFPLVLLQHCHRRGGQQNWLDLGRGVCCDKCLATDLLWPAATQVQGQLPRPARQISTPPGENSNLNCTSGMYARYQRDMHLSFHWFLSLMFCALDRQGTLLLFVGPFLDKAISDQWVHEYEYNVPALTILAVSCATAVLVNVSQFFCLGRFAAVTFQVGAASCMLLLSFACGCVFPSFLCRCNSLG
jgi:hypothetical protein